MKLQAIITNDRGILRLLLTNFQQAIESPALCRRIMEKKIKDRRIDEACHELILCEGDWASARDRMRMQRTVKDSFLKWVDGLKGGVK